MKLQFSHVGIPTKKFISKEKYESFFNIHRVDAKWSPFYIEYLRFEEKKILPEILAHKFHIGMKVDSIEEVLEEAEEIIVPIVELEEERICFIQKDGIIFELIQEGGEEYE